jgi:hypothetical protein
MLRGRNPCSRGILHRMRRNCCIIVLVAFVDAVQLLLWYEDVFFKSRASIEIGIQDTILYLDVSLLLLLLTLLITAFPRHDPFFSATCGSRNAPKRFGFLRRMGICLRKSQSPYEAKIGGRAKQGTLIVKQQTVREITINRTLANTRISS